MRFNQRLILIVVTVVLVAGLGLIVLLWPEPRLYQGQPLPSWCRTLAAGSPDAQQEAEAFFRQAGADLAPELARLLTVKDPGINRTVWGRARQWPQRIRQFALGRVAPPEAALVRQGAARALGLMGSAAHPAVPALAQALEHPDFPTALESASALGRLGPDAIPALLAASVSERASTRQLALYALGQTGPAAAVALPQVTKALEDPDPLVRARALEVLLRLGTPAFTALSQVLRQGGESEKAQVANHLAELQNNLRLVVPTLTQLTRHDSPAVRAAALRALAASRTSQRPVTQAVQAALQDPNVEVRLEAVRAFRYCSHNLPPSLPLLAKLLADDSTAVQTATLEWVAELSPATVELRAAVSDLTHSPDPAVAQAAKQALARMTEPR